MSFNLSDADLHTLRCVGECKPEEEQLAELYPLQMVYPGKWPCGCGHYICRTCLDSKGLETHFRRGITTPPFQFSCPLCRTTVTAGVPNRLITAFLEQRRSIVLPCGMQLSASKKEAHKKECLKCLLEHCSMLESRVKQLEQPPLIAMGTVPVTPFTSLC